MKDRENVLRLLDEVDNMVMVLDNAVRQGQKIEPNEARSDGGSTKIPYHETKITGYYRSRHG